MHFYLTWFLPIGWEQVFTHFCRVENVNISQCFCQEHTELLRVWVFWSVTEEKREGEERSVAVRAFISWSFLCGCDTAYVRVCVLASCFARWLCFTWVMAVRLIGCISLLLVDSNKVYCLVCECIVKILAQELSLYQWHRLLGTAHSYT